MVKGYNDLLAGGQATPKCRRARSSRVQREVERMEDLVRDLLLLAELREAPHHVDELVDLSEIVSNRVAEFALEHPDRPVTSDVAEGLTIARPPNLRRPATRQRAHERASLHAK